MFTGTVSKNCLEKKLEFLLFSRTLSEKSSAVYQSLSDEVVKCVFYVSIGKLRRNFFSGKIFKFSIFLGTLTGKNSVCRQAFFSRFEKSAFYVSVDIIWGEVFEKKTSLCRFWTTSNFFFRCETQYSTWPQENNKQVFWKKCIFFSFSFIERKFLVFVKRFPTGLSKLTPTCPQKSLEEK